MEVLNDMMAVFGYITAAGAALGVIWKGYKLLRSPSDKNSEKIAEHDRQIADLYKRSEKDYTSINEIKSLQSAMCQALIALVDHELTGNNNDGLKKTKEDLIKKLTVSS